VGALRKGKALDVAMGEGRNAVFLAQNGFQMEGLDVSSAAIEKAKKLAAEKNAALEAKTQNLDFFLMPLMKYDTIVMTYFRPVKRFFSELRRGLVLGGTVAIEAHLVEHYKKHGSTNPMIDYEDCYHPNELLHQLKDFNILFYKEIPDGTSHTVQAIALKSKA
jgi:tellurite methyltransferase